MCPTIEIPFCKRTACPPAEMLLDFHTADLRLNEKIAVAAHLQECEFCGAELQFLIAFPPLEESCETAEIPIQLRQLAEALLTEKYLNLELLTEIFAEEESVAVNKT